MNSLLFYWNMLSCVYENKLILVLTSLLYKLPTNMQIIVAEHGIWHKLLNKLIQTNNMSDTITKLVANYIKGRKAYTTFRNTTNIQH